MSFESLNLDQNILKAISECGYENPTVIQEKAIPEILAGHDLMASAQTGTGKTAAFMLPAMQILSEPVEKRKGKGPRMLVLTPTRELASQITDASIKYGKYLKQVRLACVLGGMPYPPQIRALRKPLDILVATPGRLMDHMQSGRVDLSEVRLFVLDEADRMLDMGFVEAVEEIASKLPEKHQTLLFSATLGRNIGNLAGKLLVEPKSVEAAPQNSTHANIEQRVHFCDDQKHKAKLLNHWIANPEAKQILVFTATKRDADRIADNIVNDGHEAAALHGDMNQRQRNRTMVALKSGELRVLVATDVAARGLDVPGISHVINYDLPISPQDYVHRIGRTGRAGALGTAVSLVAHREAFMVKRIEKFTGKSIKTEDIAGLEPQVRAESRDRGEGSRSDRRSRRSRGNRGFRGDRRSDNRGSYRAEGREERRSEGRTENRFDGRGDSRSEGRAENRSEFRGERKSDRGYGKRTRSPRIASSDQPMEKRETPDFEFIQLEGSAFPKHKRGPKRGGSFRRGSGQRHEGGFKQSFGRKFKGRTERGADRGSERRESL